MNNNIDNKQLKTRQPKRLHMVSADDFASAKNMLEMAILMLEAEEQTQRQTFGTMMPTMYRLRNVDGFTFQQITSLLGKCGFKLAQSSVRAYYSHFVLANENEYIKQIKENIQRFDKIRKENEGFETMSLVEKAHIILDNLQTPEDL